MEVRLAGIMVNLEEPSKEIPEQRGLRVFWRNLEAERPREVQYQTMACMTEGSWEQTRVLSEAPGPAS